ncbi:serine/threonine protein kinase, CMGC, dual-specificity [Coemansia sp. Benny D115]|nr:serine/threonine protein kinase, CMGC, dual-specificity [Coemansia sp. Benny D115]
MKNTGNLLAAAESSAPAVATTADDNTPAATGIASLEHGMGPVTAAVNGGGGDDVGSLEAAIGALSCNFDEGSSRQRTFSWVLSETSSTREASQSGGNCSPVSAGGAAEESRRLHVRLTTIDPITATISEAIKNYRESIDSRSSIGNLDPGYVKEVFIRPNILHVAIPHRTNTGSESQERTSPRISELSVDSSIGNIHRANFGSEHNSYDEELDYQDQIRVASSGSNINEQPAKFTTKGATADETGAALQAADSKREAAQRILKPIVRRDTRSGKPSSLSRTGLKSTEISAKNGQRVLSRSAKSGAKLESRPRIPIRSARRTTMGVGGSGTSTLGLSYSSSNIFPIKSRPIATHRRLSRGPPSKIASPAISSTARGLANRLTSTVEANEELEEEVEDDQDDQVDADIDTEQDTATLSAEGAALCSPSTSRPKHSSIAHSGIKRGVGLQPHHTAQAKAGPASKIATTKKTTPTISKAQTMSRATASNYLNPHLRRRSRSGVFENPSSSTSAGAGPATNTSLNATTGVATISNGSKARLGLVRQGLTAERQYLNRPSYVATAVTSEEENSGTLAMSAAAGAAGRPRRMTHQATRLTIDPERAKATTAAIETSSRIPATAIGSGLSTTRSRFPRTPSTSDMQASGSDPVSSASDKDMVDITPPSTGGSVFPKRSSMTFTSAHRPLQAKLETSSGSSNMDVDRARAAAGNMAGRTAGRPPVGAGANERLPTWRTQQAVREGNPAPQRKPTTYTGVAGTKAALRDSSTQPSSRGKSSDESKDESDSKSQQSRIRPIQTRNLQTNIAAARGAGNMSSSASAIGIGSYSAGVQQGRNPPRLGATASVVGAIAPSQAPAPNAPLQAHALGNQTARSQVGGGFQQRYVGQKGPSSTVSAAPAPNQQMHIHFPAAKATDSQAANRQQQQQPQQPTQPTAPASRSRLSNNPPSRQNGPTPDTPKLAGGVPPLTPQEAIARYGQQLSAQERTEILEFPHVYYVGNAKTRTSTRSNYGFDDERGDYIIHLNDHMLYRYELLEVLGKGSFGQVLRARDHKTGEIVAVKIIRNRKRFHHQAQVEVKLLECLRRWDPTGAHNVLQMTASFYFRNHLCIVMELLSINLYEWLKAHQFAGTPAPLLRSLTVQMLQSLKLMGQHRIIHADLKPENVLLVKPPPMPSRRSGPPGASGPPPHPLANPQLANDLQRDAYQIKVIDLGSSCFESERVYTYIQSRFYRAPEVILGLPYGTGIDMWSLGCIVAELLTGYPLFPGENEREQLASIIEVLGPPPAYMLERAPRCADFAEPAPYGVQAVPVGNMMLLPNGTCLVGNMVIKPYTNTKGKRRRPGSRPLVQILARARDPRLVDFVLRTLAWDPAMRLTPLDALQHPWITDMSIQRHPQMGMGMPMPMPNPHMPMGGVIPQQQVMQQPGFIMVPPGGNVVQQQQQNMAAAHAIGYAPQMAQQQQQQQQSGFNNMARPRKA